MNFFKLKDPFQIATGAAGIAVGAPHHGTRPNVDADRGTGPLALALAERLSATAVVVSDLRRMVDVNKNPLGLDRAARRHALRYQNEMFRNQPRLVIEIHGHVSGQYPIELSTGFELEENSAADDTYRTQLQMLKKTLPAALARTIGITPAIGIYPLDRDVKKTATNTFTFQKIRRARKLAGIDCYGLHIELGPEFRTTPTARSKGFIDALADALGTSIGALYAALPRGGADLPDASAPRAASPALVWHSFRATPIEEKHEIKHIAALHPDELDALAVLEGDPLVIRHHHETIHCPVMVSRAVPRGQIALPVRLRRQISLDARGRVEVGVLVPVPYESSTEAHPPGGGRTPGGSFVIGEMRPARRSLIWLSPHEIQQSGFQADSPIVVQGQPEIPPTNGVTLAAEAGLPRRTSAVSQPLMNRLSLTLGEVVTLEACR